jgi:hypothetical protein
MDTAHTDVWTKKIQWVKDALHVDLSGTADDAGTAAPIRPRGDTTQARAGGPPTLELLSIEIVPDNGTIDPSEPVHFKATGKYDGGAPLDLTQTVTWQSSNPAVKIESNGPDAGTATADPVTAATIITATDPATGKTGRTKLTVVRAVRGMETPFGEIRYFVADEAKVKWRISDASTAWEAFEPMTDKLDDWFKQANTANAKVPTLAEAKQDVSKNTDPAAKSAAVSAGGQKLVTDYLTQVQKRFTDDLDEAGKNAEIATAQLQADKDAQKIADLKAKSEELERQTHNFVTIIASFVKAAENPIEIVDAIGVVIEETVHDLDPWLKAANELEEEMLTNRIDTGKANLKLAQDRLEKLKKDVPAMKKKLKDIADEGDAAWDRSEGLYDKARDAARGKDRFRFHNVRDLIRLATAVSDMASAVTQTADVAQRAVTALSQWEMDPALPDLKENKKIISTWAGAAQESHGSTVSHGNLAADWLKEAQAIYAATKQILADPKQ